MVVFGLRSGPDGSGQAVGFIWSLFRAKRSILDPFRAIFDDLGPNRHCGQDWTSRIRPGTVPWSGLDLSQRLRNGQPGLDLGFLLLRQDRCLSSSHLSCLHSRHLSCLNRRHLSCLNKVVQGRPQSKIGPSLSPSPILVDHSSGPVQKHQIWPEMGRESTVWPETKTK